MYDEPASGLDPLTTNYIIELTRDLGESGKTVVFSATYLLPESPANTVTKLAIGSQTSLTHAMVGVYVVGSVAAYLGVRRFVGSRGLGT